MHSILHKVASTAFCYACCVLTRPATHSTAQCHLGCTAMRIAAELAVATALVRAVARRAAAFAPAAVTLAADLEHLHLAHHHCRDCSSLRCCCACCCCCCSHNARLNYINDFAPTQHDFKRPVYAIDAGVTKTGSLEAYQPKGAWINPEKRSWLKYEAWQPPKA
ncbi:hypothetical protein COO60DRAFT_572357 [Scenedesmus sp. NREL 46B-D3]|nr:hypothetical protein COO60DRAFT_572357 [Scenedesmus sp. NREL 46B-D3]